MFYFWKHFSIKTFVVDCQGITPNSNLKEIPQSTTKNLQLITRILFHLISAIRIYNPLRDREQLLKCLHA